MMASNGLYSLFPFEGSDVFLSSKTQYCTVFVLEVFNINGKVTKFDEKYKMFSVFLKNCLYADDSLLPTKVCSLSEWCFIFSIGVPSDHSQLRCTGFAGSY